MKQNSSNDFKLGESNTIHSKSAGIFTEKLLPNGKRVQVMNKGVFEKAVKTANQVMKK